MELLPGNHQLVAGFPPHDEEDDFFALNIIQDPERTDAELELGQRIRPQALDGTRLGRRLMQETRRYGSLHSPLVPNGQSSEVPVRLLGDHEPKRHGRHTTPTAP
jgi:hypothetical protein